MEKKEVNYAAIINRGYYLGKYLDPRLKDAVFARISELEQKGEKAHIWQKYRRGIEIGMQEWKLEQLKRANQISRSDKDRGISR